MDAARELQPETQEEPVPPVRLAYLALTDPAAWFGDLLFTLEDEDVGA